MRGSDGEAFDGGGRLHENLGRDDDIVGASDRGFGLTVAGFCGLVGALQLAFGHFSGVWWLTAASVAAAVALLRPALLAPLNRLWLRLGLLLYRIVNPVVLGLVFYTTVMPIGLLMRAVGKDPLRLRRDPEAASYWIAHEPPGPEPASMKQQF